MAPQAQLEESANDRTRSEVLRTENGSLPFSIPGKTVFLSVFFLKSEPYVHRPARKVVRQKKRTDKKQGKSGRSRARPGPGFGQLNVRYQSQNLSKAVPKMSSRFLLRSQLMGTSGSFGRWHSPQVAPAAQKPNFSSSRHFSVCRAN